MRRPNTWSDSELNLLRERYSATPWDQLTPLLGRTKPAIDQKARSLGLVRTCYNGLTLKAWTVREIKILRDVYPTETSKVVARLTGRAVTSIHKKAQALGIKKVTRNNGPTRTSTSWPWDAQDDEDLKRSYATKGVEALAAALGRSKTAIYARAHILGITNSAGQGRPAPLGAERMNRGYLMRKVAKTGIRKNDWKRVDLIEWEAMHGPIPEGYALLAPQKRPRLLESFRLVHRDELPLLKAAANASPETRRLRVLKSQFGWQLSRIEKRNESPGRAKLQHRCDWSDTDIAYLLANHNSVPLMTIAERLGRTKKALLRQLQKRGLPRKKREGSWSQYQSGTLVELYACHSASEIATVLGKSPEAIYMKAARLGLRKRAPVCKN